MAGCFDRALLSTVDAAYQLDGSTADWLRKIIQCARPALAPDLGVIGGTVRLQADRGPTFTSDLVTTEGVPAGVADFIRTHANEHTPDYVEAAIVSRATLDTASSAYERYHAPARFRDFEPLDPLRRLGVHDQLAVQSYDATGHGCMLLASFARVTDPPRHRSARWARVMAHVCAGLRLRDDLAAPEAVIEPGGRIVHAEDAAKPGAAREALRDAALTIDRARSRAGARDPARALSDWNALVSGRWSLVETFESDGRRYLVARKNDPKVDYPRALSERERQVATYAARGHSNKYIAYVLGLSRSTVSTHLNSALKRLGVRHAGELAAVMSVSDPGE
jgi:DNA-binding CsgD family transcriptional regulator